jgi:hypothetical protein
MASPSFAQSREGNASSAQQRGDRPKEGEDQPSPLAYVPITQVRSRKVSFYRPADAQAGCPPVDNASVGDEPKSYYWGQLSRFEIKRLLSNYSQWTTVFKKDAEGNIGFLPIIGGQIRAGSYLIIIDFLRYMSQTVYENEDGSGDILGRCVVGVGLRTVCDVQTFSSSAELSLIALTAQASVNRASGKLRFDSIGIASDEVAALMPTNVSLDESGIGQAAAATAAIRGLMNNNNTILVPHVIAVQPETTDEARAKLLARVTQG